MSANLASQGVLLQALQVVGNGSALTGIVLAGATVFIIEGRMRVAAAFCVVGAAFTWFGLMHGSELGFGKSPALAIAYLLAGGVVLLAGRRAIHVDGGRPEPFLAP